MTDDRHDYDDEGPPRARRDDVHTAHEAGRRMTKEMRRRQYDILLETIRRHGPGNIHFIAANCSLRLDQVHKRLPEMEGKPYYMVYRPGDTKDGPSGRACMVWHEDTQPRKPNGDLVDEPDKLDKPRPAVGGGFAMYAADDEDDGFGPAVILDDPHE